MSEEHTHEDGTTHSHEGGAVPHTHDNSETGCKCTFEKRNRLCDEHGG